jgi:hypothetical protein
MGTVPWASLGQVLVTNHVLSGAAIGALTRRPVPAFVLGVASHFVLDALPHWGKWRDDEHFFQVAVVDGLTGLAAMAALGRAAIGTGSGKTAAAVVAGMVGAALPDLDKPSAVLLKHRLWPTAVNEFHSRIQDEAPHRFVSHEVVGAALFAVSALTLLRRGAVAKS